MSSICPLYKKGIKERNTNTNTQIQQLIIENNNQDIINMQRTTTAKYAQMIKTLLFNLIVDEYDGEVLEEAKAQRTCVECYKKECLLIAFPDKLTDGETLTNKECNENQDVFEEETL